MSADKLIACPVRSSNGGEKLMLTSIKIENFRCFEKLEQGDLKRLNFVVGDGGTGKTALLESIFLAGGGSPEIYFRLRYWRGFGEYRFQNSRESFDTFFGDLFFDLKSDHGVFIRLKDSDLEDRSVRIFYGKDEPYTFSQKARDATTTSSLSSRPLHFEFKKGGQTVDTKVYFDENQLKFSGSQDVYPIHFISPVTISPSFSAQRFSVLSKANRGECLLKNVRELFPQVKDITLEYLGGDVMLHASVNDSSKKLPVAVLSGGMNKYIAIALSILTNPGGVVLVDEIENGMYYKVLPHMLRSIVKLCEEEKVQLIASTHSYELLQSLASVIEEEHIEEHVSLLRAFRAGDHSELKYISGVSYEAAIENGFEVR